MFIVKEQRQPGEWITLCITDTQMKAEAIREAMIQLGLNVGIDCSDDFKVEEV